MMPIDQIWGQLSPIREQFAQIGLVWDAGFCKILAMTINKTRN